MRRCFMVFLMLGIYNPFAFPAQGSRMDFMALSILISAQEFAGNNSISIPYQVNFPLPDNDTLYVSIQAIDDDDPTVLEAADWTLVTAEDGSLSVLTDTAYPSTTKVTLFRSVPFDQPFEFPEGGKFPTEAVERAFDRVIMQMQQLYRAVAGTAGGAIIIPGSGQTVRAMQVWANAAARAAVKPHYVGQLGVQLDTKGIWIADSTATGDWDVFTPSVADAVELPEYACICATADLGADLGPDNAKQIGLAAQLTARNPDLFLIAGNVSQSGGVDLETDFAIFSDLVASTRVAEGNKDIEFDSGAGVRSFFPHAAFASGLPGCYHEAVCGGLVDLIVLTSGFDDAGTQTVTGGVGVGSPMNLWFEGLLPTLTAPHRVVMFHLPAFALGGDSLAFPIIDPQTESDLDWPWEQYGVSAVINGHSQTNLVARKRGVVYFQIAGGYTNGILTGSLAGAGAGAVVEYADDVSSALVVLHVSLDRLAFELIDSNGVVLHTGAVGESARPWAWDVYSLGDIVAPGDVLTVATHYGDHVPQRFRLERILLASAAVDAEGYAAINITQNGTSILDGGVAHGVGANTLEIHPTSFAPDFSGYLTKGAKLEVAIASVTGGYDPPPTGLRVSFLGRWVPVS